MAILLKAASIRVSFIQIMQIRVQNKSKSGWKIRYDGDVSMINPSIMGFLFILMSLYRLVTFLILETGVDILGHGIIIFMCSIHMLTIIP